MGAESNTNKINFIDTLDPRVRKRLQKARILVCDRTELTYKAICDSDFLKFEMKDEC